MREPDQNDGENDGEDSKLRDKLLDTMLSEAVLGAKAPDLSGRIALLLRYEPLGGFNSVLHGSRRFQEMTVAKKST